jgi:hypothetical protein
MSYINTDWLLIDEQAKSLIGSGESLTAYLASADRDIEIICVKNGQIAPANIQVDAYGFATSPVLIDYGVASAMVRICRGYWGSRAGEKDIYYDKLQFWMAEQERCKSLITKETIGGITDSNGDALPTDSFIEIVPMYI